MGIWFGMFPLLDGLTREASTRGGPALLRAAGLGACLLLSVAFYAAAFWLAGAVILGAQEAVLDAARVMTFCLLGGILSLAAFFVGQYLAR